MFKASYNNNLFSTNIVERNPANYFGVGEYETLIALSKNYTFYETCYNNIDTYKKASDNIFKIEEFNSNYNRIAPVLTDSNKVNKLCSLAENSDVLLNKLGDIDYMINKIDYSSEILDNIEKVTDSKEFKNAINSIKIFPTKTKIDLEHSIAENSKSAILESLKPIKELIGEYAQITAHVHAVSSVYVAKEFEMVDPETQEIKVNLINEAFDLIRKSESLGNDESALRSILAQNITLDLEIENEN